MAVQERDMTVVSAEIKVEANEKLEVFAKMMQTSKSAIIRWAIEDYLAKKLRHEEAAS